MQAPGIVGHPFQEPRDRVQQGQVVGDHPFDIRRMILTTTSSPDCSVAACTWASDADAERCLVEGGEQFVNGFAAAPLHPGNGKGGVERRYAILQSGEFIRIRGRQQVAARGEDLAEFDEHRTEMRKRPSQAFGRGCRRPGHQDKAQQTHQSALRRDGQGNLIEAVAQNGPPNGDETSHAASRNAFFRATLPAAPFPGADLRGTERGLVTSHLDAAPRHPPSSPSASTSESRVFNHGCERRPVRMDGDGFNKVPVWRRSAATTRPRNGHRLWTHARRPRDPGVRRVRELQHHHGTPRAQYPMDLPQPRSLSVRFRSPKAITTLSNVSAARAALPRRPVPSRCWRVPHR